MHSHSVSPDFSEDAVAEEFNHPAKNGNSNARRNVKHFQLTTLPNHDIRICTTFGQSNVNNTLFTLTIKIRYTVSQRSLDTGSNILT